MTLRNRLIPLLLLLLLFQLLLLYLHNAEFSSLSWVFTLSGSCLLWTKKFAWMEICTKLLFNSRSLLLKYNCAQNKAGLIQSSILNIFLFGSAYFDQCFNRREVELSWKHMF